MTTGRRARISIAELVTLLLFSVAGLTAHRALASRAVVAQPPVEGEMLPGEVSPSVRLASRRHGPIGVPGAAADHVAHAESTEEAPTPIGGSAPTVPLPSPGSRVVAHPRPAISATHRVRSTMVVRPRDFAVLQIPVPASVQGGGPIEWHARAAEEMQLLSGVTGMVRAVEDSVTMVVRVPEGSPAGERDAAIIEFSSATTSVETRVSLVVARIRRPSVRLDRRLIIVPQGERTIVRAQVVNLGNATDTFDLRASVPNVLVATVTPALVVLNAGESRTVVIETRQRSANGAGGGFLRLAAHASAGDSSSSQTQIDFAPRAPVGPRGPYLRLGAATVVGDDRGATPVLGAAISGTYRGNIQLYGQAVHPLDAGDVNAVGLARVGYSVNGAFLQASAPTWRSRIGVLSERASVTTGENIFGVGVSGGARHGGWDASAIAAQPASWTPGSGQMVSATAGYRGPFGRASLTASHLRDGFAGGRSLDAIGVGIQTSPLDGLTVDGEAAYRGFDGRAGVGLAATTEYRSSTRFGRVELAHTPGGTTAFAAATERAGASGGLRVGRRFTLQASAFRASNRPDGQDPSRSSGIGGGVSTLLNDESTLDLTVSGRSFESEATPTGFGNEEVTARAGLRTRYRGLVLAGYAGVGSSARTLSPLSGGTAKVSGTRRVAGGSALLPTADGSFSLAVDYESNARGTGFLPQAMSVGLAGNQIRIPGLTSGPRLDVSVQRYDWFDTRQAGTQILVGTEFGLGTDYTARVSLERNPFIRAVGASTPWTMSLRLERGLHLPGGRRAAVRGVVYEDRNANGAQDPTEMFLSGVRVRRGNDFATTDRRGRFEFEAPGSSAVYVDPLSLPEDQVPTGPGIPSAGGNPLQLRVVPTAPLIIRLRYVVDSLGRAPTTPKNRLTVAIRDSANVVWALRPDSSGHVAFDALPPGIYTIEVDLSDGNERLRLLRAAPQVIIQPGTKTEPVTLEIGLRPVRVFNNLDGGREAVGGRRR